MSMGSRSGVQQESLWIETSSLPRTSGHPFYERLNTLLTQHGFDTFAEIACAEFYADGVGRPSTPPGVYFRMLLVGFFEGIDSERGIAWRTADSMALRSFLGYSLSETTPNARCAVWRGDLVGLVRRIGLIGRKLRRVRVENGARGEDGNSGRERSRWLATVV